jgi:hypothetical protein
MSLIGEITLLADTEEEFEYPRYSDPGRILVCIEPPDTDVYRFYYEVLDYDGDSCVFFIQEGTGFEYWLDDYLDIEQPGIYVIEGITGSYIRGEWGFTDDDEEWDFESVRYASDEEIRTGNLGEK